MVEINASTTIKVKRKVSPKPPANRAAVGVSSAIGRVGAGVGKATATGGAGAQQRRGSVAPPLRPAVLQTPADIASKLTSLASKDEKKAFVVDHLFRQVLGEHVVLQLQTPHAASTTRDRGAAAADVAVAAKELGVVFVLKECGLLLELQRILMPSGIEAILGKNVDTNKKSTIRASPSAVSLQSLASEDSTSVLNGNDDTTQSLAGLSIGTDSKRGKTTPPNAREGCLLLLRALAELVGTPAEPYIGGAFLAAALDECASNSSHVRAAAEDTTSALVGMSSPWAVPSIVVPVLLLSLHNKEWRVKATALERLQQCAAVAPKLVHKLIPILIPAITNQVWDTKAQVSKAARSALQTICFINTNPDIRPAVPAIVHAICKPADTNKAVSELMGTTFVVPVDASTLAMLCPVLARALKEKLAIHKRAACLVISNMSKLVEAPEAVAPFGDLLVPELKRVTENVQFEEIRDEALKALSSLTKALGDYYNISNSAASAANGTNDNDDAAEMHQESSLVNAEQARIIQERQAEAKRQEEIKRKEEEERQKFKEAMDAQRELDKLQVEQQQKEKQQEELKKEKAKLSTKARTGTCHSCGRKKCKTTCSFYEPA